MALRWASLRTSSVIAIAAIVGGQCICSAQDILRFETLVSGEVDARVIATALDEIDFRERASLYFTPTLSPSRSAEIIQERIDREREEVILELEPFLSSYIHGLLLEPAAELSAALDTARLGDRWDGPPGTLQPFVSGAALVRRHAASDSGQEPDQPDESFFRIRPLAKAGRLFESFEPDGPEVLFYYRPATGAGVAEWLARYKRGTLPRGVNSIEPAIEFNAPEGEREEERPAMRTLSSEAMCVSIAGAADPDYSLQWNLQMIGYIPASLGLAISPVSVGVIDSGVRTDHVEFQGRINFPVDIYPEDNDAYPINDMNFDDDDEFGHGTKCAGVIAAACDNGRLIKGISVASVIPVNAAMPTGGSYEIVRYVDGLYWAVFHGARVLNLSFGSRSTLTAERPTKYEIRGSKYAARKQAVVVTSVGRPDGSSEPNYPAAIPGYIGVGAVDHVREHLSGLSDVGQWVDLTAPGYRRFADPPEPAGIVTTSRFHCRSGSYSFDETSAAAPHVSGVAASLLSVYPNLSATDVSKTMFLSALDQVGRPSEDIAGRDDYHGFGLLSMSRAFRVGRAISSARSVWPYFNW